MLANRFLRLAVLYALFGIAVVRPQHGHVVLLLVQHVLEVIGHKQAEAGIQCLPGGIQLTVRQVVHAIRHALQGNDLAHMMVVFAIAQAAAAG